MKIWIAFLSLIAVFLGAHLVHAGFGIKTKKDLEKYNGKCVSKLSIPKGLDDLYGIWQFPDDKKTHCYMKCIFENLGYFDEKNGYDLPKMQYQLVGDQHDQKDKLHGQLETCFKFAADSGDACTKVYRDAMCLFRDNLSLTKKSFGYL